MLNEVKHDRLYKHIVAQITRSILKGEKRPGDQLPTEPELEEHYGVSRTVVREAIRALSFQGLVEVSPGRGTFITHPAIETVTNSMHLLLELEDHSFDELLVAREILEVPIARLAAQNHTQESLERIHKYLDQMRQSLGDPESFIMHDTAFHAELATATQNMVLSIIIRPIISMMQASREAATRVPDMPKRALDFHEKIYQAVASRDADLAEKAMRDHLQQIEDDIARARTINND